MASAKVKRILYIGQTILFSAFTGEVNFVGCEILKHATVRHVFAERVYILKISLQYSNV